jgi:crossover junction endodeoxyribonuclease RusA
MIKLLLPYPPSMNTYWRNFRGRTVLSKKGREYKVAVQEYVIEHDIPSVHDMRISVLLILRPRDKRIIDIDNRIKAVLDSLEEAGVYLNDAQIDRLEIIRGTQVKGGAIHVFISEINPLQLEAESKLLLS